MAQNPPDSPSRTRDRRRGRPFGIALPRLFQGYLFLGVAGIVLAVFVFTNILVARLANQVQSTSEVFARFCATASYPATTDSTLSSIVSEVITGLNFPIVLTDAQGVPRAWKGISVPSSDVPPEALEELATLMPFQARGTPSASVRTIGKLSPEMTSVTIEDSVESVVAG